MAVHKSRGKSYVALAPVPGQRDEYTWRAAIINAVVLTVFSWAIFIKGLGLTIPLWPTFIGA